jgi:transcription elongation GreA/GreB family factor
MDPLEKKRALVDELIGLLRADLEAAEHAQRATVAGATHEEARPENDKDTRALEQTYLARGQAQRVEQLRAELAELSAIPLRNFSATAPIALGALVSAEEDGAALSWFVAPARGGTALGGGVQVVTPSSPLGRALIGKHAGEVCEITLPQRTREIEILSVD